MRTIAWVAAALFFAGTPALADDKIYTSSADFLAAVFPVDTVNFDTTPPGYYGTPGSLTQDGLKIDANDNLFVQSTNQYGTGSFVTAQGATPTDVDLSFSSPVNALGFLYETGTTFVLTINGISSPFDGADFPATGYAGIATGKSFTSADISTTSAGIDLDNISFGQAKVVSAAPEPAAWLLMLIGVGGAGAALRRKRALSDAGHLSLA